MGILNDTLASGLQSLGVNAGKVRVDLPEYVGGDYPSGLLFFEIINDKEPVEPTLVLKGTFAPHQPWTFGGSQRIVKEYYSGTDVPSIQVLGSEEDDIPIRGRLKSKFFKRSGPDDLRLAAEAYQQVLDQLRRRGNMIKIQLGEWQRYGFIKRGSFNLATRADIEYQIDFMVISEQKPEFAKFTERTDDDLQGPNQALIDAANAQLDAARNFPDEMPVSIANQINGYISDVASAINTVTGFVNGILTDAEQLQASAQRAIGLIRYSRAQISIAKRRLGLLSYQVSNLGSQASSEAGKAVASVESLNHISGVNLTFNNFNQRMAELQRKFASLAFTIPNVRHLVRENDTLQKISMRYYNTAENWIYIYDHNKLTTTVLEKGQILEIPRL